MSQLTDLYDCKAYTERKRGARLIIKLDSPYMNMIAATQPGFMQGMLPEVAWDQGFMSRCILVFYGEKIIRDLFDVPEVKIEGLGKELLVVRNMKGRFEWADDAKAFINEWHKAGGKPRPTHPKLINYCERRTAHLLKLSQIASADVSNEMLITLGHIQTGLDWLLEAESQMENIFKAMTSGGDSNVMSEVFHFLMTAYVRGGKKPVARSRVLAFIGSVPMPTEYARS